MCESVLASRPRFLVEFARQSFDLTAKTRSLRSEGRIETRKLPWIRTVDSDRRGEKEKKDGRNALNLERERASKNKRRKHLTLPLSLSLSSSLRLSASKTQAASRLREQQSEPNEKQIKSEMKSPLSFLLAALLALIFLLSFSSTAALAQDCAAAIAAVPTGCGSKRFCEHTNCGGGSDVSTYAKCCCCQGSG